MADKISWTVRQVTKRTGHWNDGCLGFANDNYWPTARGRRRRRKPPFKTVDSGQRRLRGIIFERVKPAEAG
ncbi:hypothetical protein [Paraburkholderia steynii]|uniref:hypothetical protein n=1 Tax=Paraburkholderia steynii TaxID=1245441 RepID=UPI00115FA400|nr:hypothetical protein [Paraburkholderia steynii]